MKIFIERVVSIIQKYALALILLYCLLINLDLLQTYRNYPSDEIAIADSSYSVFSGNPIPKLQVWSHIFPGAEEISFLYPPLYFYLAGLFMKLVGFSPLALGLLHLLVRLSTASILFLVLKRTRLPILWGLVVCIWWVSCMRLGFYVSRPDDVAVLFVLLAIFYTDLSGEGSLLRLIGAGIFLGLAFLTYPIALIVGSLLCLLNLFRQRQLRPLSIATILAAAGIVSSLWLLWIVPYWSEFQRFFMGFVVPDAGAKDYFTSIANHILTLTKGNVPYLQTSVFPFFLLDLFLSGLLILKSRALIFRVAMIHLPFLTAILLISRDRAHIYDVSWLAVALLFTCMVLAVEYGFHHKEWSSRWFTPIVSILLGLILIQSASLLYFQILKVVGNVVYEQNCLSSPLKDIRAQIGTGEKVVTLDGLTFYAVRSENAVYIPAGISGVTPGGVAFTTTYDDTFRYLVTSTPLANLTTYMLKFPWNAKTSIWFRERFELIAQVGGQSSCLKKYPFARFSFAALPVYIYRHK